MSGPTTTTNFLFTGATGTFTSILRSFAGELSYIGGSVLARFLAHPHAASNKFHFTVLVRDPTKAEKFRALGDNVTAVLGSHSDVQLVERLASEADVVIATADADDLGAAKATLTGLRKRHAQSGVAPIFINTSGTGVLSDQAKGMYAGTTVYDDSDADQIEGIAPTASHRDVDLAITAADAEGYIKSYIILPSTIYGLATGLLVDAGLQNPHSIQVPSLISAALDRGRAGMVGEGKNLWPNVEIHELADLYTTLYDRIVADASTGHGRNGFYFGASGEHSLYDVGRAVGAVLVALGKSESAEPTPFTQAELDKYFGGSPDLGSNSRCRATRSLSLGWNPVKTTKDLLATIQSEAEAIIENKAESAVLKAWTRGR
ncbi:NAD-binding protein [Mycena olivaceomarginata]|nr:NAD-binding protein [Mycena olivaceomarginata]